MIYFLHTHMENLTSQQMQSSENQIPEVVNLPSNSFHKQRIIKMLVVSLISSLAVIFLTTPIVKVISGFSLFQQFNFFPGMAESFAIIPSFLFISAIILAPVKVILREWKYVIVGFLVMIITVISIFLINSYRMNKFFRGLSAELNQSIALSKQTQITISNFEELPTYDESQRLINISFRINFTSNTTADMNLTPLIRFKGQHITGGEFPFGFDPTEVVFDNKTESYSSESFFKIEAGRPHEIVFVLKDLSKGAEYMSYQPGNFQVGIIYSIHIIDKLGFGQGNATLIEDIIDKTGKSVKEGPAFEVLLFNSAEYKLKNP